MGAGTTSGPVHPAVRGPPRPVGRELFAHNLPHDVEGRPPVDVLEQRVIDQRLVVAASAKLMPWARRFASAFRGCHSNRPRIVYGRLSSEASGIASEQRQDFGGRIVAPLSAAALLRAAAISCLTASRPGNSRLAFVYQPRALSRSPSSMCTTPCSHAASVEDSFWTISWAAFQSPASSRSSTRVVSMARV